MTVENHQSPPWGRTTKVVVALIILILTALLAQRFQALIGQIVGAAILAYILNPIIALLDRRTSLKRGPVLAIVYLLFAIGVISGLVALGVAAFQQVSAFIELVPDLIETVVNIFQDLTNRTEPIVFLTYKI
ncbi:MAG: AI-2E family transporter, partial [Chloroflexi bacterium]|nr:AI-2E family transporter [Chloroflexota bacterium]